MHVHAFKQDFTQDMVDLGVRHSECFPVRGCRTLANGLCCSLI
jgi:hypothetical protein